MGEEHFLSIRLAGQANCTTSGYQRVRERIQLPQGTLLPSDFWQALSLDELAESQAAVPLQDVTVLFGTWPGDIDDGFEELIRDLRERNVTGGDSS